MRRILTLMTKREVFKLLKLISIYYDSFDLQQEKVDEWCSILKGESYQKLEENLRKHVAYSPYPPKVSELLCKPESGARAIPNYEWFFKQVILKRENRFTKQSLILM